MRDHLPVSATETAPARRSTPSLVVRGLIVFMATVVAVYVVLMVLVLVLGSVGTSTSYSEHVGPAPAGDRPTSIEECERRPDC